MQTETRATHIECLVLAELIAQLHVCLKTGKHCQFQNIFRHFNYFILARPIDKLWIVLLFCCVLCTWLSVNSEAKS